MINDTTLTLPARRRTIAPSHRMGAMALKFDSQKSFDQNIRDFHDHLVQLDPECAKILFDTLPVLQPDDEETSARANRPAFNEAVLQALESLRPKSVGQ